MLGKVSWGEFGAVMVILLVLYYLVIGAKYYREEIKKLLGGGFPKRVTAEKETGGETSTADYGGADSIDELEAVVNDIRYAILDRAGKGASKPELLRQLKARLENYTGLRKPAFRVAINNYIIQHAEEICGVVFSEGELNGAWDSLPR